MNQNTNSNELSKPTHYPNLSQSWELFAFLLLFSLCLEFLISSLALVIPAKFKNWVTLFSYMASFTLLLYFVKKQLNMRLQPFNIHYGKPPIKVLVYLLFITPLCTIILEPLSEGIPEPKFMEEYLNNIVSINIPSFLTAVIAAPLLEEILCRGVILEGLLKNRMNPTNAIICSSLIFAVMHMNLTQGISAFTIGCLTGWTYYKTRSLWASIFIHFVNNGLAFLLLAITNNPHLTTKELLGENRYTSIYYIALLVLSILLYCLYRYFRTENVKLQNNGQIE